MIPFTARVIVINPKGEVLLQRKSQNSKNAAGNWELPGGKINFTEDELIERQQSGLPLERSDIDAIVEELMEEKNIDIKELVQKSPNKLIRLGEFGYDFFNNRTQQIEIRKVALFLIRLEDSYLQDISKTGLAEDNLDDYGWFGLDTIIQMEQTISENSRFYKKFNISEHISGLQ